MNSASRLWQCALMVTLECCHTGRPGHQHHDLISYLVTLSWQWASQSLPYPNNANYWLGSDKYQLSLLWLDRNPNSRSHETCAPPIQPPFPVTHMSIAGYHHLECVPLDVSLAGYLTVGDTGQQLLEAMAELKQDKRNNKQGLKWCLAKTVEIKTRLLHRRRISNKTWIFTHMII